MAQIVEHKKTSKNIVKIFVYPRGKPNEKRRIYEINKATREIRYYPKDYAFVRKITLRGFTKLPSEFAKKGYIKGGVMYYLAKKFADRDVFQFIIAKEAQSQIAEEDGKCSVLLNYESLSWLSKHLGRMIYEGKVKKSRFVDEFFGDKFPGYFEKPGPTTGRQRAASVISNLDVSIIEHLNAEEVDKLVDFFEDFITQRYKSKLHKRKLFKAVKIRVDDIALNEIVESFEEMLAGNYSESKWGEFLKKNLFLIDSKYVKVIPQLNVVLAGARNVDFGLVDSQGYLDLFEIKKPVTTLLASKQDRGNYYWSTEAVKAIVQAEKYLYNAASKANDLAADIQRQKGLSVQVVKPRAVVIIGTRDQLDGDAKKEDFRVLRTSLKNVEVILYDELLESLKNQQSKIYTE